MEFNATAVPGFQTLFDEVKEKIKNTDGCHYLRLYRDMHRPEIFFTYSHWESEAHLQAYRQSDLFADVWAKTKAGFNKRAEAWSLEGLHQLPAVC